MRILLADDEDKVRSALRLLLEQEPGLNVVAEADGLLAEVQAAAPEVVLLEWKLPGLSAAILWKLRSFCPGVGLVAMSGRSEARLAALNAGADADAFVGKGEPPEGLLAALEGVSKG